MNQDLDNNAEKVDDKLQDEWLNQNLKQIQLEPPRDFTTKVVEQVEVKPNLLGGSPIFWILAFAPTVILAWVGLSILSDFNQSQQFNLTFLPDVTKIISLYDLSKYVSMIVSAGLFFIGFDFILSKHRVRESLFSLMLM